MKEIFESAFQICGTDKLSHGYSEFYNQVINFNPDSILEVGIKKGKSLAAWRLLYPRAHITGIDITTKNFVSNMIELSKAEIIIKDSTSPAIKDIVKNKFDIIIDDGSHFYKDICKTFFNLQYKFNRLYIIEDAMYKQDFIVRFIKNLGYNNVEIFNSNVKDVPVDKFFVTRKPGHKNINMKVSLNMIVVRI